MTSDQAAEDAVAQVARTSYGRLVAWLAARSGDIATAEDALADALARALETWPRDGVPDKPEAWLMTAAKRRMIDHARRHRVRREAATTLMMLAEERDHPPSAFPDDRLKLLFVCAHPAIDPALHTKLMLQTVLGLDAATIAAAFLEPPATLRQSLWRAKVKIRTAGIGFTVPDASELPDRLAAVLEAVYAAFGTGWDDWAGLRGGLAGEAIWLARLLADYLPGQAETHGLLALLLFAEARKPARRDADGRFVPLSEQNTALWSAEMLVEADAALRHAATLSAPGRFQFEAAIQAVHADRRRSGHTDWASVALLYAGLHAVAPTIGVAVARAAAVAEAQGKAAGRNLLMALPQEAVASYQPYWVLRAHLGMEVDDALAQALRLTADPSARALLLRRYAGGDRGGLSENFTIADA